MNSEAPTLHYVYTHIVLRDFVLENKEQFYNIFNAGPDNLIEFLKDSWSNLAQNNPQLRGKEIEIKDSDFDVSVSDLDNEKKLLFKQIEENRGNLLNEKHWKYDE